MKAAILVPLFCLAVCSLFVYLYANDATVIADDAFGDSYSPDDMNNSFNQTLNDSESEISAQMESSDFTYTTTTLFYAVFISSISCIIAGSITILGSTLGHGFGKSMGALVMYFGLWFTFSVLGLVGLLCVPLYGILLYAFMSMVFTLGVYDEVS